MASPSRIPGDDLDTLEMLAHELYAAVLAVHHASGLGDDTAHSVRVRARCELMRLTTQLDRARTGATAGVKRAFTHMHRLEEIVSGELVCAAERLALVADAAALREEHEPSAELSAVTIARVGKRLQELI